MSLRRQLIKARHPCIPAKHSDLSTGPCFSREGPVWGDMVASKSQKASKPCWGSQAQGGNYKVVSQFIYFP